MNYKKMTNKKCKKKSKVRVSFADSVQLLMAILMLLTSMLSCYQVYQTQKSIDYNKKSDDVNRKLEHFSNFLPVFNFQNVNTQKININGESRLYTCVNVMNKSDKIATNIYYQNNYATVFQEKENKNLKIFNNDNNSNFNIEPNQGENCSNPYLNSNKYSTDYLVHDGFYFIFSIPEKQIEELKQKKIYNHFYFDDQLGFNYAILLEFCVIDETHISLSTKMGQKTYYYDEPNWQLTSNAKFAGDRDLSPPKEPH